MLDELSRIDKKISDLEVQLEETKKFRTKLIQSKKDALEPIRYEIEKTIDGWNLTLTSGIVMEGLDSLNVCETLMKEAHKKAQWRNQSFELYDRNSGATYKDNRIFTEFLYVEKKSSNSSDTTEFVQVDPSEESIKHFDKRTRRIRNSKLPTKNTKVKKIDTRIFDRNY